MGTRQPRRHPLTRRPLGRSLPIRCLLPDPAMHPYELTAGKAATIAYLSTWALWTETMRAYVGSDVETAYDHFIEAAAYDRAQEVRYGPWLGLLPVESDRWPWRADYERVVAPEEDWPMHAGEISCDCRPRRDPYCGTRTCVGLPLVSRPERDTNGYIISCSVTDSNTTRP
jgi:hypothetical protein